MTAGSNSRGWPGRLVGLKGSVLTTPRGPRQIYSGKSCGGYSFLCRTCVNILYLVSGTFPGYPALDGLSARGSAITTDSKRTINLHPDILRAIMALQVKRTKSTRTFPPPRAAVPARGRRGQILEKAVAAEKTEKKKQAAAERRRLKAEAKRHAEQRAARQAALKAAILPLIVARDGVRELARALYGAILELGQKGLRGIKLATGACRSLAAMLAGAGRSAISAIKAGLGAVTATLRRINDAITAGIGMARALLRRLDPRPAIEFLGKSVMALFAWIGRMALCSLLAIKTAIAWLPRLNPLLYFGGAIARAFLILKQGGGLLARIVEPLRNLTGHLQPRRLLSYSYAAAIGASLVVVGGQIALQVAAEKEDRQATEKLASYQAASEVPAETAAAMAILQAGEAAPEEVPAADKLAVVTAKMDRAPAPLMPGRDATGPARTGPARTAPPVRSAARAPVTPPVTVPTPAKVATPAPAAKPAPDYATAYATTPARPVIAVVIDDMGMVQGTLKRFARLPAEITFAFLPYSPNLEYQTRVMRDNGHELIVHLPMEPKRRTADPGPQALLTRLSDAELEQRIAWNLGRFEGFTGINNHMGSRFTEDPRVMRAVMSALKKRDLYFLDSMTTSRSVGIPMATEYGVPQAQRDIFLDNERDYDAILRQLRKAERIAERRGHVIAIGHPYRITYQVLKDWAPTLQRKGIRLVALSRLILRPAPDLRVAENSVVTELSREMPAQESRAMVSSGAGGLH